MTQGTFARKINVAKSVPNSCAHSSSMSRMGVRRGDKDSAKTPRAAANLSPFYGLRTMGRGDRHSFGLGKETRKAGATTFNADPSPRQLADGKGCILNFNKMHHINSSTGGQGNEASTTKHARPTFSDTRFTSTFPFRTTPYYIQKFCVI